MTKRPTALAAVVAGWLASACAGGPADPPPPPTAAEPGVLYAIGAGAGAQLAPYALSEAEAREVARGLLDASLGRVEASTLTLADAERVQAFRARRGGTTAADEAPGAESPDGSAERALYAMGLGAGAQLLPYRLDAAEAAEVARGLQDASRGRAADPGRPPADPERVEAFRERRKRELARHERRAGQPLLDAAARAPGSVRHESGTLVQELERGVGDSPGIFDWVVVNFHGTLRDGTVFESNRGRAPRRVLLGTTLRCWQDALGAAAPGARLRVVCPPHRGYGYGGVEGSVPGGAVLTFELDLLEVIPGEAE